MVQLAVEVIEVMSTNLVEQIAATAATLPPERQREALALIEQLAERAANVKTHVPRAGRRLKGATADGASVSGEEIRAERREMWRGYTREDET